MNVELQVINVFVFIFIFIAILISIVNLRKSFIYYTLIFLFVIVSSYLVSIRSIDYGDTQSYLRYFKDVSDNQHIEVGFKWLTILFQYFNISFSYYIFIIGFLTSSIYAYSICRLNRIISSTETTTAIIVLFSSYCFFQYHYFMFEAIRDGLASSIFFIALCNLIQGKKVNFIFLMFVGGIFHKTTFIFIPLFLLINMNFTRNVYLYIYAFLLLISTVIKSVLLKITFLGPLASKLLEYYSQDLAPSNTIFVRYGIIFFTVYFFYNKVNFYGKKIFIIIFWMILIATAFSAFPDMYRRLLIKVEYLSYPMLFLVLLNQFKTIKIFDLIIINSRFVFAVLLAAIYIIFLSNYFSYYSLLNIKPLFKLF